MQAKFIDDNTLRLDADTREEVLQLEAFVHRGYKYGYYHAGSGFGIGKGKMLIGMTKPTKVKGLKVLAR